MCDNNDKKSDGKDSCIETLLLVGNSPNLVDAHNTRAEWGRLFDKLEGHVADYLEGIRELPSYPQKMQAICNVYRMCSQMQDAEGSRERLKSGLKEWLAGVGGMLPTAVHRALVSLDFKHYLTTNYDFALDRARQRKENPNQSFTQKADISEKKVEDFLNGKGTYTYTAPENECPVHHIHGDVSDPSGMVMTPQSYIQAVRHLMEQDGNVKWLDHFCESEVHICGLNLRPEEAVVWYALERKARMLREKEVVCSAPRTYVYLFFQEDDPKDRLDKLALKKYLTTFAVNTVLVPVRQGDYASAWKQLIGEILLNKSKLKIYSKADTDEELNDELIDALDKTQKGGGRIASKGNNMSTAFVCHYRFPYHCQFTLSTIKQEMISQSGKWLCYCMIDGERHMYKFPYLEPIPCLSCAEKKIQLLLNYRTGELFKISDDNKKLIHLGNGRRVDDIFHFTKMIYPSK